MLLSRCPQHRPHCRRLRLQLHRMYRHLQLQLQHLQLQHLSRHRHCLLPDQRQLARQPQSRRHQQILQRHQRVLLLNRHHRLPARPQTTSSAPSKKWTKWRRFSARNNDLGALNLGLRAVFLYNNVYEVILKRVTKLLFLQLHLSFPPSRTTARQALGSKPRDLELSQRVARLDDMGERMAIQRIHVLILPVLIVVCTVPVVAIVAR